MTDAIAISVNGVPIRLTDERWRHIIQEHPELAVMKASIADVVEMPDSIHAGREATLMAVRRRNHLYLVVVYREINQADGLVITSHFSRRPPRQGLVWKR